MLPTSKSPSVCLYLLNLPLMLPSVIFKFLDIAEHDLILELVVSVGPAPCFLGLRVNPLPRMKVFWVTVVGHYRPVGN